MGCGPEKMPMLSAFLHFGVSLSCKGSARSYALPECSDRPFPYLPHFPGFVPPRKSLLQDAAARFPVRSFCDPVRSFFDRIRQCSLRFRRMPPYFVPVLRSVPPDGESCRKHAWASGGWPLLSASSARTHSFPYRPHSGQDQ